MSGTSKAEVIVSRLTGLALAVTLLLGARSGHAHGDGVDLLILDAPERVTVVRRIGDLTVVESRRRARLWRSTTVSVSVSSSASHR